VQYTRATTLTLGMSTAKKVEVAQGAPG